MKKIHTLQDALAYQLQRLFYAELKIQKELSICLPNVSSAKIKMELKKYIDNVSNKVLKLQRIFNYLMQEEIERRNEVIDKLIDETHHMLNYTESAHLKDILMVGCIQNINSYKISSYRTAYLFAAELELDTAADLLQQILEWEQETSKTLSTLSIEEFNKTDTGVVKK